MSWWCFSNFDLDMCFAPQQRALFQHLNCQKCAGPEVFCHLEMCSVPQGLHFLNISTSKMVRACGGFTNVYHFEFEMCFAPQRHALFEHLNLNIQKWPEHVVFCHFEIRNVFRTTRPCTFSSSELPKVLRAWCGLRATACALFEHFNFQKCPTLMCF